MSGSLSIAITADPYLPVPPVQYGGIERVIQFLVDGLVARGHRVALFAHRDSHVSGELVPYPSNRNESFRDTMRNAALIASRVLPGRFDVVHSFGRLSYLTPLAISRVPKIMSYQRPITPRSIASARRLFGSAISFTACSQHMIEPVRSLGHWDVVYNGVPLDAYRFEAHVPDDAPLVFLGRLDHEKGAHIAIEVAKRAGRRIVLAGNVSNQTEYFEREVKRHFDDDRVKYIGPVDDRAKNELLGRAAALLMPILWDEPFGIVMAEALACGTPVIGLRRGSVPEVVKPGQTGYVADDMDGLTAAIAQLPAIDRRACRADAAARFSDAVIVREYEAIYERLCRRATTAPAAQRA